MTYHDFLVFAGWIFIGFLVLGTIAYIKKQFDELKGLDSHDDDL